MKEGHGMNSRNNKKQVHDYVDPSHEVELNLFYLHYQDALHLLEFTENENYKFSSLCARHALISVFFASEALINRVAGNFIKPGALPNGFEKLNFADKWHALSLVCSDKSDKSHTFDKGNEPFQRFAELVTIRNWLVHPHACEFLPARIDPNTHNTLSSGSTWPWFETLKGEVWQHTHIPKNPFEISTSHVRQAINILDDMIKQLMICLPDKVTEDWLSEIGVREKDKPISYKMPANGPWSGYAPKNVSIG